MLIDFLSELQALGSCNQFVNNSSSHRQFSVPAGHFKKNYAENTASLFRNFTHDDQTEENCEKIVRKIIDSVIILVIKGSEKRAKTHSGTTVSEKTISSWTV